MPAEIVVVIEHQDTLSAAAALLVQEGRSEAGESAAHDDEVIVCIGLCARARPFGARPGHGMRDLERPRVTAAESRQCRRVAPVLRQQLERRQGTAGGDAQRHAAKEVPSRDIQL